MARNCYRPLHTVLIALGAVPIIVWKFYWRSIWVDFVFITYVLTAYTIVLLILDYPGRESPWYWKPVLVLLILHAVVIAAFAFAAFAIQVTGIKPPTAMFIGIALPAAFVESWVWIRLMDRFTPEDESYEG
jgi:hypothetical protein